VLCLWAHHKWVKSLLIFTTQDTFFSLHNTLISVSSQTPLINLTIKLLLRLRLYIGRRCHPALTLDSLNLMISRSNTIRHTQMCVFVTFAVLLSHYRPEQQLGPPVPTPDVTSPSHCTAAYIPPAVQDLPHTHHRVHSNLYVATHTHTHVTYFRFIKNANVWTAAPHYVTFCVILIIVVRQSRY
jgi:hypothetical protein